MHGSARQGRPTIIAVLVAIFLIFVWGENAIIPSFQKCIGEAAAAQSHSNDQKERFIIGHFVGREVVCTGRLLDEHSGLIGALATIFVGGFTATLWWSTNRLWREAEKQRTDAAKARAEDIIANQASLAIARKSADALPVIERAYIYPEILAPGAIKELIRGASIYYLDPDKSDTIVPETAEISFRFTNYGKTPAILKSAYAGYGIYPFGGEIGLSIPEAILGERDSTSPIPVAMAVGMTRNQAIGIGYNTTALVFSGSIIFEDIWGNEHTTDFVFQWDKDIERMSLSVVRTKTAEKKQEERD